MVCKLFGGQASQHRTKLSQPLSQPLAIVPVERSYYSSMQGNLCQREDPTCKRENKNLDVRTQSTQAPGDVVGRANLAKKQANLAKKPRPQSSHNRRLQGRWVYERDVYVYDGACL